VSFYLRKYISQKYASEIWAIITNLMVPLANFIAIAIAMKFVTPEELGNFQTIFLIAPYFMFVPLGVFNGLRRNIAYYSGRGETEKVKHQIETSMFVAHIVAIIGFIVGVGMFYIYWSSNASPLILTYVLGLIIHLLLFSYNTHFYSVFSGKKSFNVLGHINIIRSFFSILGAFFPALFGAIGLVFRHLLMTTGALLSRLIFRNSNYGTKTSFHYYEFRDLVSCGFPIMISGYINGLLLVADRSVIATFLSAEAVGYYALSAFMLGAVVQVPQSLSLVVYPLAAEAYGKTGKPSVLRRYMFFSLFLNICTLVPIGGLGYLFIGDIVENFFPKYLDGIACAQVACITVVFMCYRGVNIIFMVLKKNLVYQALLVAGVFIVWLVGYFAIQSGYDLKGVAAVRALATLLIGIGSIVYGLYLTRNNS
jgi:O-antigen/teichoic acid export membrane protein